MLEVKKIDWSILKKINEVFIQAAHIIKLNDKEKIGMVRG